MISGIKIKPSVTILLNSVSDRSKSNGNENKSRNDVMFILYYLSKRF